MVNSTLEIIFFSTDIQCYKIYGLLDSCLDSVNKKN